MAEVCSLVPTVRKRKGIEFEERDSNLYKAIKETVKDRKTAWQMWAYTKTSDFKDKYKDIVEYDEMGEVTFPSLIRVLDFENAYNTQKGIADATRDNGFDKRVFSSPTEAVSAINEFNAKENNLVATLRKVDGGYRVNVLPKTGKNIQAAREQAYNHKLTGEIISLLEKLGFSVDFVTNPKFDGLFNPEQATLRDGLLTVISIAKGERGEEALPEEFAHLIIEGLINHPLVQRLLASLTDEQVREVLGDEYEQYAKEYGNDAQRLRKEAAGKMLAQYIRKQGTISNKVVQQKTSLLSRIWNAIKNLFSKVSRQQIQEAELRASNEVAGIYDLIASNEAIPLVDKRSILSADKLYALSEKLNTMEKAAHEGLSITAKMRQWIGRQKSSKSPEYTNTTAHLQDISKHIESDEFLAGVVSFLNDARDQLKRISGDVKRQRDNINTGLSDIKAINEIAKVAREVDTMVMGYQKTINELATIDSLPIEEIREFGIGKRHTGTENMSNDDVRERAGELADIAKECGKLMNELDTWKANTNRNIVLWASRTVYGKDIARGIGSNRERVLALEQILDHADRDINFVDRWLTAMSDADDPLLVMFDGIVKNQQYQRDMELIEINAQIAAADEKLRKAGFTSDFMYERDSNGNLTGRIISIYDFEEYNKALEKKKKSLRERQTRNGKTDTWYGNELSNWKRKMLKRVYVDPEIDRLYQEKGENAVGVTDVYEEVPDTRRFDKQLNRIENLQPAQREYYNTMMDIKRRMMAKLPRRGQHIFNAVYITKDLVEGIMDNTTDNPARATLDYYKRKFIRRPDDIGFGITDDFKKEIRDIILEQKEEIPTAEKILKTLSDALDEDIAAAVPPRKIASIIRKYRNQLKKGTIETANKAHDLMVQDIVELISSSNFYIVDTDFAGHRVQKLPVYYSRPPKDMSMLSTDFSGTLTAYSAMATNYEKMNEVVDILEVGRTFVNERDVLETEGNQSVMSRFTALRNTFHTLVTVAGSKSAIAGRMNDWMSSVVYEERKNDEGSVNVLGANVDVAKTLDAIKDYTGLLGLGFNLFSTVSNLAVGKLQQWIEAAAGEYFGLKDYSKACGQYSELMWGHMAEMSSPVKKNKLSLLIQMFDPMGDYFENLRDPNFSGHAVSRILGNGVLAYIGMNAGEHILHCTTMLAILNHTKLNKTNAQGKKEEISLYDALQVKEVDGVYKLVLEDGLSYERDLIDNTGTEKSNKNFGKPLRDENGKIKTETVYLSSTSDARNVVHGEYDPKMKIDRPAAYKNYLNYIIRKKRVIRKVNDSLNGAFNANDKGAIHKKAVGRLVMQYRQWMPAHYERRFARSHYDNDLEQFREGYYVTVAKTLNQMRKELGKGKFELLKYKNTLSEHERANLRRANAEIAEFLMFLFLVRTSGRVKDRDRSWLEKMYLYQIRRMYLEVGASMPFNGGFFSNIFTLLQSPAASIDTFEKFSKVIQIWNAMDEVQRGRYQGWSEWERDVFKLIPGFDQITKAYHFDDSMFSMYEKDN